MSNLNKKILLFVMLVGLTLGLVGCSNPDNSVRIRFAEEEYELRLNETKVIEPTIIKSSQVEDVELSYSSSDESIVKVVDGVLVPVAMGEATVKVEWAERDIIFDKVTVRVIKAALPQAVLNYEAAMLKNDTQTVSVSLANNLTEATYTISALTPEIATVEGDVITAVAVGEAKFEVVVADYEEEETYEFSVKVEESDFAIKYNLDGGTNHAENPAGYNALELPLPLLEPAKAGYTFLGWYHNEEKVEAIPAGTLGDYEVTAKWQIIEYTIEVEGLEGAAFEAGYELPKAYTVESDEIVFAAPAKVGYTFLGYYAGEEKVEKIAKGSTGDVELVAKWEVIEYSISYDLAGGEVESSYVYDESNAVKEFALTQYLNYNVNGLEASLRQKANLTWWGHIALKATEDPEIFEIIQIANKSTGITVEFDYVIAWHSACTDTASKGTMDSILNNSADYIGDYVVIKGIPAEAGAASMTVQVYDKADMVYQSGTVASYTVEDEVVFTAPTKVGYEFLGWYAGEEKIEKIAKGSTGNVSVAAKWEIIDYTISYDLAGGEWPAAINTHDLIVAEFIKDFSAFQGKAITSPAEYWAASQKTNFWKNAEMHAKWSWIFEFLSPLAKTQGQDSQYIDNMTAEEMVISGYATQNVAVFFLQANATIWNETYKEANGGLASKWTTVDCTGVEFEDYASYLPACFGIVTETYTVADEVQLITPSKFDHIFLGWYIGEEKVESIEAGTTGNIQLVAKWKQIVRYDIAWDLAGGAWVEGQEGAALFEEDHFAEVKLPTPVKKYHTFLGWYAGEEKVEALTANQDYELTAKWEDQRINGGTQYILFQLEGGDWEEGSIPGVDVTDYVEVLKLIPVKFGYKFTEWVVESDNETELVTIVYTAQWEKVEVYTITYVLNEGVNAEGNPAQYTSETLPLELAPATKEGFIFLGWFDGETKVEAIAAGTTGNLTLEARWESTAIEITFDLAGGEMEGNAPTYAEISAELLADFNAIGGTSLDAAGFAKGSSSAIKVVMADAGFLTKWAWFFTFAIEDLKAANPEATSAYLLDVYPALEESLKGESAIFTGGNGANARTMIRNYMGGLFLQAKGCPSNTVFQEFATDFSDAARQAALVAAAPQSYTFEYEAGSALPTPTKEGYVFKGWYNAEDQLVATAIASGTLTAKWEEEILGPYAISYDLAGGAWGTVAPASHEEIKTLFLADMAAYLQSLGQQVEAIDPVDQTDEHLTDFFGISYAQRDNIPAFFTTHEVYSAKWKWMYDYVATVSGADLTNSTILRSNIHGFVYSTTKLGWPVSHDFSSVNYGDYSSLIPATLGSVQAGPAEYAYGEALDLPTPVKEGATFAGWTLNGEAFAGITATTKGDLALVATWN